MRARAGRPVMPWWAHRVILRCSVRVCPVIMLVLAMRCLPCLWPRCAVSWLILRPLWLRSAWSWRRRGTQVAEWAGHTVDVLLRVYAKCIAGRQEEAKRRILEATQPERDDGKPGSDNQDQGQDERPN